jgi:hypothetical protein
MKLTQAVFDIKKAGIGKGAFSLSRQSLDNSKLGKTAQPFHEKSAYKSTIMQRFNNEEPNTTSVAFFEAKESLSDKRHTDVMSLK